MADVRLAAVEKTYPNGLKAISDLNLEVRDGEFLVLVGPSGCGKSAALRMVARLEPITSGDIYVGGRRVNDDAPKDRNIAMVFQNFALYPQMTVEGNIGFPLRLQKVAKTERRQRVAATADVLELEEQLTRRPGQLSGGQRQRVAMGRAMVRSPSVFLMDEPLSNLDAKLRVQMRAEIARLQQELQVTTMYVTHDQIEAMTMGHRVAVMKNGVLQQLAPPEELYQRPNNAFVAGFIGSPAMNLFLGELDRDGDQLSLTVGAQVWRLSPELGATRSGLLDYVGRAVAVGIRPEDMEDAALDKGHPDDQRLEALVDLREALGAETLLDFDLAVRHFMTGDPDALDDLGAHRVSRFTARFSPLSLARVGDRIQVNVRTERLYFFDPTTMLAIRD